MAETTTTIPWPLPCPSPLAVVATRRATARIFSWSATDEPPYFWTISAMLREIYTPAREAGKVGARGAVRSGRGLRARPSHLAQTDVFAEQEEPADHRDGDELHGVEDDGVAHRLGAGDAEQPERHRRGGV